MKCATHPDVETNLRCGKCGKPICPQCMVQTEVGARCPTCAQTQKAPTFSVPAKYYLRAVGAALVMAVVCGAVWGILELVIPFFSLNLLLAPAAGYIIGETTGISVNRKRSIGLAVIAGIAVIASYLITFLFLGRIPFGLYNILYHLLALGVGIFVTVTRLRP